MEETGFYCKEFKENTFPVLDDIVTSKAKLVDVEIWDCKVCGFPIYIEK